MGTKRSPQKKERPIVWIGLLGLVILAGALIWQAKTLPILPEPAPAPVPIRFKVPPMPSTLANQTPEPATDPIESVQAIQTTPTKVDEAVTQVVEPPERNDSQTASAETVPPITAVSVSDANTPATAAQSEPIATDPGRGAVVENPPMPQQEPTPVAGQPEPKLQKTKNEKVLQPVPPASASQTDLVATSPGSDAPAPYTLQVGSYLTKTYAEDKMAALTQKGYEPFILEVTDAKQQKWYAVRFGQFETYKQAAQFLSEFKEKENMDGIIRHSDSPQD